MRAKISERAGRGYLALWGVSEATALSEARAILAETEPEGTHIRLEDLKVFVFDTERIVLAEALANFVDREVTA